MRFASLFLVLAPLLVVSCGGSSDPSELTDEGNRALGSGDFAAAQTAFEGALEAIGDDSGHALYLEAKLGAIEAMTKADPGTALADLKALAAAQADKVTDRDFSRIASSMGMNDHLDEAIELLGFAMKTYEDSESLDKQVKALGDKAAAKAAETGDNSALEAIKGLGYGG